MSEPIEFTYASPRLGLPLLFSGQAQKEFFVNEALSRIDALAHPAIEGSSDDPPAAPETGETWLIGAAPTASWSDHAGEIASFQSGNWIFAAPVTGMAIFDKSAGQMRRFDGVWRFAEAVEEPVGGNTVDQEARTAIAALIAALSETGILPDA